jgi:hypothetical protein
MVKVGFHLSLPCAFQDILVIAPDFGSLQIRYDLAIVEQDIGNKINIEIEQAAHINNL